jgi:NitT/TauT family transport system permease protein
MPPWLTEIRGRVPWSIAILLGLVPIVAILAAWWFCTHGAIVEERLISPTILPSPGEVLGVLPELVTRTDRSDGSLFLLHHVLASLQRVSLGFLLGAACALPLGVLMGAFNAGRATFAPFMTISGYIPLSTLIPLTLSWFGTDEKQKVIFLAMAFFIFLLPQVVKAIDGVADIYLRTARTLGAQRRHLVFRVLVPVAAPDLWHALRLAFGVGWTYIVLTEALVYKDGMGYMIAIAQRQGPREQIYLVIILITAIAWLVDLGWERLGRRLFPWRRPERT